MRATPLVCLCFCPRVFLSSRVTGACPVTTDLIRVNLKTTTASVFAKTDNTFYVMNEPKKGKRRCNKITVKHTTSQQKHSR